MGTLVAMHYRTTLAVWLADHTYVKCGNGGKAWRCHGGKTGGKELRSGPGSTLRAEFIASPDETALIKCYLVNGVCHQSANRILLPANLTVRGARGYRISEARFGVYGRPRGKGMFKHCVAPFHRFEGVVGELPECMGAAPRAEEPGAEAAPDGGAPIDPQGQSYLAAVQKMYAERIGSVDAAQQFDDDSLVNFMVQLFELRLEYAPDGAVPGNLRGRLLDIRAQLERRQIELEEAVTQGKVALRDYPEESDRLTEQFQQQMLDALGPRAYALLFEAEPNKIVKLADPDIAGPIYGQR